MSYTDFQAYLDKSHPEKSVCFERDLLPQLKKLTADCFRAVYNKIDPSKRLNTFEVFGLDFMFDDEFKPYLIEVNTNPNIECCCPLLSKIIPPMLDGAFRIAIDPYFPLPEGWAMKKQVVQEVCPETKFSLCFDEHVDGPQLAEAFKTKSDVIPEIEEEDDETSEEESDEEAPIDHGVKKSLVEEL
jgi:tubulin monoglycylase TTLL3/8